MEGLFCYEEFFVDGEGSGKENDPTWAYPIEIEESCDAVEERGLEEVLVLLENTSLNQEEQKVACSCLANSLVFWWLVMRRTKFST